MLLVLEELMPDAWYLVPGIRAIQKERPHARTS